MLTLVDSNKENQTRTGQKLMQFGVTVNLMSTSTLDALTAESLQVLARTISDVGDEQTAMKIMGLSKRLAGQKRTLYIAFCGLFSAGKSSLINAICGIEHFATGAVPTTEIVSEAAHKTDNGMILLMDTPGIDSTDEAHQRATDEALYRADLVALVMDYQHVEAEENLELARNMVDQGKRLLLIVNQVDKHLDFELPFATFKNRIERTFSDYDIPFDRIYYTSSRSSQYNEIHELQKRLNELSAKSDVLIAGSLTQALRDLAGQHAQFVFSEKHQELEARLMERIGFIPFDDAEARQLQDEHGKGLADLQKSMAEGLRKLQKEIDQAAATHHRMIDLAQISPYDTTEKGRFFVESLRPDFKVGWFGSREKTENERFTRLQTFSLELTERSEKYLLWPLQNSLRQWLSTADWSQREWVTSVDAISLSVTPEFCREQVHHGALLSDAYPYQYVKDVVSGVKQQALTQVTRLFDEWRQEAIETHQQASTDAELELADLQGKLDGLSAWRELYQDEQTMIGRMLEQVGLGQEEERL